MRLDVRFSEDNRLMRGVLFEEQDAQFFSTFGEIQEVIADAPLYSGGYTVVPAMDEQMLETAEKLMQENLIIKPIPFYDVGNTTNGRTIYIGSEVE